MGSKDLREQIIFQHYISYLVRHFLRPDTSVGMNIVSRDKPWDFSVELSTNDAFNVEITSIADNRWLFEKNTREEKLAVVSGEDKIDFRQLKKLNQWFGDEKVTSLIESLTKDSVSNGSQVENPYFKQGFTIFLSDTKNEDKDLAEMMLEAIRKKKEKKHDDKEKTVLILDNRTSRFQTDDLWDAMEQVDNELQDAPFPEIYFYTGYYSDNDGSNAEYSFTPLKLSKVRKDQLEEELKSGRLRLDEETGIAYD